jgi:hypothetical protein
MKIQEMSEGFKFYFWFTHFNKGEDNSKVLLPGFCKRQNTIAGKKTSNCDEASTSIDGDLLIV